MKVFWNRNHTSERKRRASRGFSLTEMLVVIAIIAILVGIAFLAASGLIASMRQNKLDTIAQDIYVAAQDRLTEMYTDNRADAVSYEKLEADGGSTAGMFLLKADDDAHKPKDWNPDIPYAGLNAMYNKDAAAAAVLLPKGALSAEVEDNHWIVEYNPDYGYIYGVFYSEKGFAPSEIDSWYRSGKANLYRVFADRKGSGVGYYGGVGVLGGKVVMTNTSLNVSVNIVNAEELKADISVRIPTEFKDRPVRLTLTFTGEQSGVVRERTVVKTYLDGYFNRTYSLVMDSFNKSGGKSQQFGSQDLFDGMFPGENVTMVVDAELGTAGLGTFTPDPALDTARTTAVFNSLFQSVEGTTAYVSAGRHLQNLNNLSQTGLSSVEITNVVQTGNIDFKNKTDDVVDDTAYWWKETYGDLKFEPINNSRIVSMVGSGVDEENKVVYYIIYGMTVNVTEGEPAGLFGTLGKPDGSVTIQGVSLVGVTAIDRSSQSSVGALAGKTSGSVQLIHTGAYLALDDYNNHSYNDPVPEGESLNMPVILTGRIVGGLIGEVGSGVTATECYSAQVLRGTVFAGGLFGSVDGKMTLSRSYADCYLTADGGTVGGLTGKCASNSTISSCYSAGFVMGEPVNSAGFTASRVASVSDSYCVLNIGPDTYSVLNSGSDSEGTNQSVVTTKFYTTVGSGSSVSNVYYARQDGVVYDANKIEKVGVEKGYSDLRNSKAQNGNKNGIDLSGNFRRSSSSDDTTAYNMIEGYGLTNYPYPFLYQENGDVLHHYGDWEGNLFDPGTLVYFEEYSDGYRGYYGAGRNYLNSSKEVVLDGYALLYTDTSVTQNGYGTEDVATVRFNGSTYSIDPIDLATDNYPVILRSVGQNKVEGHFYFRDLPADIVNAPAAAVGNFYSFIQVETPDTKYDENKGVSYYYFNPHFASTVEQVESSGSSRPTLASTAKNIVRIRTPRQLYLLSKYYSGHAAALSYQVTLEQGRSLNYSVYHWTDAGFDSAVSVQAPIGTANKPFNATYDGKCYVITGVSFQSDTLYTGMFGYIGKNANNASQYGKLRNILLAAEMEDGRTISFTNAPQEANNYAYAGTLAGYNNGYIFNCAVAGYGIDMDTYNTTLYVGGLVGRNSGTISNCAAENPFIVVRTNSANGFVGAFAGLNDGSGTIASCCSISDLDVTRYSSGSVRMGGFAGSNAGSIRSSYTVCAMTASNILERNIDGFTSTGGSVQSCYFLSGGTYKFVGKVHPYGQESQTANKVVGWINMPGAVNGPSLNGFGPVASAAKCYYYGMMEDTKGDMSGKFPFASPVEVDGSVKEDRYIFVGDWVTDDVFGDYGVLYWEHEEGGSNDGYHFDLVDGNGERFTTLCESHDDGGVVTEYGYGYYRLRQAFDRVSEATFENVQVLDSYRNTYAENDLSSQFANSYEFILYNTSDAFADSPDGVYVLGESKYGKASMTVTKEDENGAPYTEDVYFTFSPFFGASVQMGTGTPTTMEIRSIDQLQFLNWNQGSSRSVTKYEYTDAGQLSYATIWNSYSSGRGDNRSTSLYHKVGSDYYPVSIYRKWYGGYYYYYLSANNERIADGDSYDIVSGLYTRKELSTGTELDKANTKQLVDASNYRLFTYLGQTNHANDDRATQGKSEAYNSEVFAWKWEQTHDIKLDATVSTGFTPIAAAATSSDNTYYSAVLYAWFGSTYDGHSYKIEDVNITSDAYTVGLFGVTAGADMKNIIMYSENNATIRRATTGSSPAGAYSLGGLIGVAYDYNNTSDNKAIQNCAIAGYNIVDDSKNQQTLGEANVGGLVGVCNGNLTHCSAVTDIQINCTHRGASGTGYNQAKWGNFLRVGGLTGATMGSVSDCYTGGSISVGSGTLMENVNANGQFVSNNTKDRVIVSSEGSSSTSVYIAGVGGSGFAQNYKNFSGEVNLREGNPSFTNCYTYMSFPKLEGTIRSISIIGSVADRYNNGATLSIDNCYYLDAIIDEAEMLSNVPSFYYHNRVQNLKKTLTNNGNYYFDEMLMGTGRAEHRLFQDQDQNCYTGDLELEEKDLQGMRSLVPGSGWTRVTTTENGVTINGKYSFPGSDHQLDGRNYPFPTIVTQKSDATGGTVHVHYGYWPKGEGLYSSVSNITLDLLVVGEDSQSVSLTNYDNYRISAISNLDDLTLCYSELQEDGTVANDLEKSDIVQVEPELRDDGTVNLNILGLQEGSSTIKAEYEGNEVEIQVTVTAEFSISVVPVTVTVDENGAVTQVTDVEDPTAIPEAFQQDDLYWKLSGVNSQGTPIELTAEEPENWRVEANTIDVNFDEYEFLTAQTENKEVLLRFRSNAAVLHNVQVTAYNVPGVSGQRVTGTRSREISFLINQNPPTVTVFAYPQGTEGNRIVSTLYQIAGENGNVRYFFDKLGGVEVSALDAPGETPAGYSEFQGYFLPVNEDGIAVPFAQLDENGQYTISYYDVIDNESKSLTVYGGWKMAQFQAVFEPGYREVTVEGVEQDPDTSKYTVVYTLDQSFVVPGVNPSVFEDEILDRTAVFSGWKITDADVDSNWNVGDPVSPGDVVEKGHYGNVTFQAVWSSRYEIHYFQEDGVTEYVGLNEKYTSYVGESSRISLYTPDAPEDSELLFIGWKLRESETNTDLTGWTTDVLYKDPVTGISCTGNVELVAQWGKSHTISYKNGEEDFLSESYAEGGMYTFHAGPEAPKGYRFDRWKVTAVSEDAEGWALDRTYTAGEQLDNSQALYKGNVTLTAQWELATYNISFELNGGTFNDQDFIDPIVYQLGDMITLPQGLSKDECEGFQWVVTYAENNDDAGCYWKEGTVISLGTLTVDETLYGDVTLSARWNVKTYTIFYYPNGGTMELEKIDERYAQQFTKASGFVFADATRNGYRLVGWVQDPQLSENDCFGTNTYQAGYFMENPTGNVHMVAQWAPIEYTIRFHYSDASAEDEMLFSQGYTVEKPGQLRELPTVTGYSVTGWMTGESAEGSWQANTEYPVGMDLTGMYGDADLYCTRTPIQYRVTYFDGEQLGDPDSYIITDTVTVREAPEAKPVDGKAQFFTGWVASTTGESGGWTDGGTYQPGDAVGPGAYGNVTLTAGFESRTLTLSASSAGSNGSKTYSVKDGYKEESFALYFLEEYTAPVRDGWELEGWYTDKDGTGQKVLDAKGDFARNSDGSYVANIPNFIADGKFNLTENQTLYARWMRKVNIFTKKTFSQNIPAKTTVMIGSEDEDGLHLLTAKRSNNSYSLTVTNVSKTNGYYYSDGVSDDKNLNWNISGSVKDCFIRCVGANQRYLGWDYSWDYSNYGWYWYVTLKQNTDNNWTVENDTIYFTYTSYGGGWPNVTPYYLSITASNVSLTTDSSTANFYVIDQTEEYSYD